MNTQHTCVVDDQRVTELKMGREKSNLSRDW